LLRDALSEGKASSLSSSGIYQLQIVSPLLVVYGVAWSLLVVGADEEKGGVAMHIVSQL